MEMYPEAFVAQYGLVCFWLGAGYGLMVAWAYRRRSAWGVRGKENATGRRSVAL